MQDIATEKEIAVVESRCPSGMPVLVAHPKDAADLPMVVLLHERYGYTDHQRHASERLASAGYCVGAPHLYYDHQDQEALKAGEQRAHLPDPVAVERIHDAFTVIEQTSGSTSQHRVVIGVCQTGRAPLCYEAKYPLTAGVILYGAGKDDEWTVTDAQPVPLDDLIGTGNAPLLGVFGEKDPLISLDGILRLRSSFERHRRSYKIRVFADAPHGFLNDIMLARYREQSAEEAWDEIVAFINMAVSGDGAGRVTWDFTSDISPSYDFSKNPRL